LFQTAFPKRIAVINTDDPWGRTLRSQLTQGVVTYGLQPTAMVSGEKYELSPQGTQVTIRYTAGKECFSSPLLGKPNVYNILAATATALTINISSSNIRHGIASMKGVPGRFEKLKNKFGLHIFVDYAHTDAALQSLLETTTQLYEGKTILVFGAGGDRDKSKRPRMGRAAGKLADWSIITSDNPRNEDPLAIISDIEKGIQNSGQGKYEIEPDRRTAIKKALNMAKKGDVVLVAGKGHENYQIIKDKVYDFDDVEVTKSILDDMGRT
jgi:UDP-N-acetylmuramoyl-L-alanyl-D-glutamate--2,6-diaminopimelate ligase